MPFLNFCDYCQNFSNSFLARRNVMDGLCHTNGLSTISGLKKDVKVNISVQSSKKIIEKP